MLAAYRLTKQMIQHNCIHTLFSCIIGLAVGGDSAAAGTIEYFITEAKSTDAIGSYPDGEWDISGSITTDGTLGELKPTNIVSFAIDIGGPIPHSFDLLGTTSWKRPVCLPRLRRSVCFPGRSKTEYPTTETKSG